MTVTVTLTLHGTLRRLTPDGRGAARVTLAAGATVGDALRGAGVGGGTEAVCVVRGGLAVDPDAALADGEVLHVFPLMGGG